MTQPKTPSEMEAELHAINRRQDVLCMFLLGRTLDGDSAMIIQPTPDSWCGRIAIEVKQINDIACGLKERFAWGAAAIVGAGAVINLTIVIWEHYAK
ncbi:MAG: hypothetical protein ABSH01_25145 [Terriglobia bacterium]